MNKIIELNNSDMDCKVQAGVTRKELNDYIRDTGLFFLLTLELTHQLAVCVLHERREQRLLSMAP